MKITHSAINRAVTFFMIYLIAVGFGLFSLARLKIDLYPKLNFPVIAVITQYTGVGPFDIENIISRPIEETVASVENIEKVTSKSTQGLSLVMLEFSWDTDMNQAEIDVRNNLEYIRDYLPDDISAPMVFAFDPSQQPILYLSVQSQLHGQAELRRISEQDIEPRLERIPGVATAFTMGGMRREIKIYVDPGRMHAHNISTQQVISALQSNNLQLPSGWIEDKEREFTIRTSGEYTNLEQIENTPVTQINGSIIHVKDVATVVDGFADQRSKVWNNNNPAVMLMVQKQSDANSVAVAREVMSRLKDIEAELPTGVKIATVIDLSSFISRAISNLRNTALQAIVLTLLVLLFFLRNLRSSLIVAVSIPVSMIVTFAVMDQAGLTLNMISMAGLALAVGMLVDSSIVVLESIYRKREEGEKIKEASEDGASEVGMAITASTLTTLAVFVPVLFVPGIAGVLFNDMVITIVFSLSVSLVVALTLIPLLTSRFLRFSHTEINWAFLKNLNKRIESWINNLIDFYGKSLGWAIHNRKKVIWSAIGLFVLALVMLGFAGGEFMPKTDMGFIAVAVDRTPGTSLDAMEKSMHQLDQIIMDNTPEIENIYTNFGQGEGIMAMFSTQGSNEGDITIRLKNLKERDRGMLKIQDDLREKVKVLPDVNVRFEDRGQSAMMGVGADIVVEIFGHNIEIAEALANQIREKVKNIEGAVNVETSFKEAIPELKVNLDRQRISDLGLSTAYIGQIISSSILGTVATQFREGGEEYDIRIQLDKRSRESKVDLENILIMTPTGQQIPLRAVAQVEYSKAPQQIIREDQERLVTVNIGISGRSLTAITADVQKVIKNTPIPNDFRIEIGGVAEEQQESFMYLGVAFLVAILLVYMVMAAQFESLLEPFIIIFTIPLSLIGVALMLLITGTDLSIMALIGLVMLVGIEVNNGIVLVDYTNQLRRRGQEMFEAIINAGRIRMRPVLMTALTTMLAMSPLALGLGEGAESWAPMARSVIGGLIAATFMTLIVIPVIYASFGLRSMKAKAKHEEHLKRKYGDQYLQDENV